MVSANVALPAPTGVTVVPVETATELAGAVQQHAASADIVTMAAAVADFRPADVSDVKLKKDSAVEPTAIALERNPDILRALVANKSAGQTIVGFAAETGDETAAVIEYGQKKLAAKGCDLLVVNDVSGGAVFERAENQVIILDRAGGQQSLPRADKSRVADQVWDAVIAFRGAAL